MKRIKLGFFLPLLFFSSLTAKEVLIRCAVIEAQPGTHYSLSDSDREYSVGSNEAAIGLTINEFCKGEVQQYDSIDQCMLNIVESKGRVLFSPLILTHPGKKMDITNQLDSEEKISLHLCPVVSEDWQNVALNFDFTFSSRRSHLPLIKTIHIPGDVSLSDGQVLMFLGVPEGADSSSLFLFFEVQLLEEEEVANLLRRR